MNNKKKTISVIIPAFNEENHIEDTLQALTVNDRLDITVVDNGSTDKTASIVKQMGVKVIHFPSGTIAAVRNRGVQESLADILVFIDADVIVSSEWHEKLSAVRQQLNKFPLTVTGSRVQSADKNNWLHKYWFSELTNYEAPYINSGHLITTRQLFDKIDGFSENLKTAEDYDFCMKAVGAGAVIHNNPELVVVHEGYPASIAKFIRRERWHGSQDVENMHQFLGSKIAWIACLNLFLLIITFFLSVYGIFAALPIYLAIMYAVSLLLTFYKFGPKKLSYLIVMPVIFYLYICGRSLALIDRLVSQKRQ